MITAGAFAAGFVLIALLVSLGVFGGFNLRLTHYLQGRGSFGQDLGLGIFAYLGSIELTVRLIHDQLPLDPGRRSAWALSLGDTELL